jgi:hypothetical protein
MHKLIPLIGLLIFMPVMADEIYKWVDEYGQVHYSDVPQDGATEVEIAPIQTFSAPSVTASTSSSNDDKDANETLVNYESMEITSPATEETIWNTGGTVTIAVRTRPGLQIGHQIRMYLDGKPLPNLAPGTSSQQVSEVVRGEHQLRAEVWDENGVILIKANPSTFFYQQTAVNRR